MEREEQDRLIAEIFKQRHIIEAQKKNELQKGDVVLNQYVPNVRTGANKAEVSGTTDDPTKLNATLVINTTNLIDSHMDCHIPGLWNKTLAETQVLYLLQEHSMSFDKIIADSVKDGLKASAATMPWSDLGYSYQGTTEALLFKTSINAKRNKFMFDQYREGYVLNHSVGMRYVKLYLCINRDDADYAAEKDSWDKYYPQVVNKEVADNRGYFWAVTEAKLVEGSAVVRGSNSATPTLSIEENKAAAGTLNIPEPSEDTPKQSISNFLF